MSKRFGVAGLALVVGVLTSWAEVVPVTVEGARTWIGAATDGDWNESANWSSAGVPAATEAVKFTRATTIQPPADFVGVLWASNAQVTVTIDEPTRFTLKLGSVATEQAAFVKRGAGQLTLQPRCGLNYGTITVAEGEVAFADNGREAPGMFDKLVVADGAKASVVESPFADRHGVVVRSGLSTVAAVALADYALTQAQVDKSWSTCIDAMSFTNSFYVPSSAGAKDGNA